MHFGTPFAFLIPSLTQNPSWRTYGLTQFFMARQNYESTPIRESKKERIINFNVAV